jgi:hypothetical protein
MAAPRRKYDDATESVPPPFGMRRPDQPITTQTVIGVPQSISDGLEQVSAYVLKHGTRDQKFEYYIDGVLVRVSLSDKAIVRGFRSVEGTF